MKPISNPHKEIYIKVYSSFILSSQMLEKPNGPSADEWINKLWTTHTMENSSAIKSKGLPIYRTTQMNLTDMLSEGNQTQKTP